MGNFVSAGSAKRLAKQQAREARRRAWPGWNRKGLIFEDTKLFIASAQRARTWTPEGKRLVRVVAYYTALAQLGNEFYGRCPLPRCDGDLWVSPIRNIAKCHDCEAKHDAASFVMAMEGLDRKRAVKRLSMRVWNPIAPIVFERLPVLPRKKPPRKKPFRSLAVTCGAKTRKGEPCKRKLLLRGGKCPNHGGLSTGPKTPEGKARSVAQLRPYKKGHVHSAAAIAARIASLKRNRAKRLALAQHMAKPAPRIGARLGPMERFNRFIGRAS